MNLIISERRLKNLLKLNYVAGLNDTWKCEHDRLIEGQILDVKKRMMK